MINKKPLRSAVRYMYDLQKLRIQFGNRAKSEKAELEDADQEFLKEQQRMLAELEKHALREVKRLLKPWPIWAWLEAQHGIAETMGGVLVSSFDIERAGTVSKMWAFAGLAVVNGHADRLVKGQKARFDPWLKSKMISVMGGNLMKATVYDGQGYWHQSYRANPHYSAAAAKALPKGVEPPTHIIRCGHDKVFDAALLEQAPPEVKTIYIRSRPASDEIVWRKFYDDYKHRKESMRVDTCMGCLGTGTYKISDKEKERLALLVSLRDKGRLDEDELGELEELEATVAGKLCGNCNGTGGPAPWGRSPMHRHNAALRYLAKMFLQQFWIQWRTLEGLEVRVPYAEEYLNRAHHT